MPALCNWTSLACLVLADMACSIQLYNCMYCTWVSQLLLFSVFWFCRNASVESSNLHTKMSWSREFSSSGLQWTCRSAGGTSVISGGCYLALSSWMGMLLVSRNSASFPYCRVFVFFFVFFFEHNHTLSGKKMVTGMQVVTASQVPARNRLCVCVCAWL